LGSLRTNEEIENNLSKEMILTMGMLLGGTPIIIYGDELGIEQVFHFTKIFLLN
jgi:glycosidase